MHTHEMMLAGQLCQHVGRCILNLPQDGWEKEEGLQYRPAQDVVKEKGRELLSPFGKNVLKRIQFELLIVGKEGIPPHYHKVTDSVVLVLDIETPYQWEAVLEKGLAGSGDRKLCRIPLQKQQLFFLPRMIAHGFMPKAREIDSVLPLYLLVANCLKYDPEDTYCL